LTPATASCAVTYFAATDVGRERDHNEDSHGEFVLDDGSLVLVVADGMGGHEGGEVASQIAVEAIGHIARHSPASDPREKLHNGFLVAHQRVISQADKTGKSGMGTTAVAVLVRGSEAYVAHIGDSRLYHLRNGVVAWMTGDHTRVQRMVSMGILSPSEAKHHPDANIVTRAIGHGVSADGAPLLPEVQTEPLLLQPGDVMVLCSDGVYDDVTDAEIAAIALTKLPQDAAPALVALANERGGHDNITVTVVQYGERSAASAVPAAAPASASPAAAPSAGPSASPAAVAVAAVAPVAQGRRKWVAVGAVVALVVAAAGLGIGLLARRNRSSAGQAKGDSGVASAPADLGSVPVRDLSTRDSVRDLSLRPADLLPAAKTAAPVSPAKPAPPAPKTAAPAAPAKTAAPTKPAAPTKTAAPAKSAPPAATKPAPHKETK
jgi:serine/threonine protein phosphatase PrpC